MLSSIFLTAAKHFFNFLTHSELAYFLQSNQSIYSHIKQSSLSDPQHSYWLNFYLTSTANSAQQIQYVHQRKELCVNIQRLSLEFLKSMNDSDIQAILYNSATNENYFPNLTDITIGGCHSLTDLAVEYIFNYCPALTSLSLYWNPQFTAAIANSFQSHQQIAHNLKKLTLSGVKHLTNASIVQIAEKCVNLTYLDTTRIADLSAEGLIGIGRNIKNLEIFINYANPLTDDLGLISIGNKCRNLFVVDLTGARLISDKAIATIVQNNPQLIKLILQWCLLLGDDSLEAIGQNCHALRHLSVHGLQQITPRGIELLAEGCTKLEIIDINGCSGLTQGGDYSPSAKKNCAELKKLFPRLQTSLPL
jgi:hypothetical protein